METEFDVDVDIEFGADNSVEDKQVCLKSLHQSHPTTIYNHIMSLISTQATSDLHNSITQHRPQHSDVRDAGCAGRAGARTERRARRAQGTQGAQGAQDTQDPRHTRKTNTLTLKHN